MVELLNKGKFKLQTIDVSYLVIAGGASGGAGNPAGIGATGGGGAGGYVILTLQKLLVAVVLPKHH